MATGTIKKKLEDKKCGFIAVDGGGDDVFFHMSATNEQFDNLREGQKVSFDVEKAERGPRAQNVVALDGSQSADAPQDMAA